MFNFINFFGKVKNQIPPELHYNFEPLKPNQKIIKMDRYFIIQQSVSKSVSKIKNSPHIKWRAVGGPSWNRTSHLLPRKFSGESV
jgi:hypothetical protein